MCGLSALCRQKIYTCNCSVSGKEGTGGEQQPHSWKIFKTGKGTGILTQSGSVKTVDKTP